MAFKFFNPASLLPSGREASIAPVPQNDTIGTLLGATMENVQRVTRDKREFDLLIAEGNATADYLETIDPALATLVRQKVSKYAPDPFLGYGAVDAKAERNNLLKGTLEFAKLENDRQANAARLAASNSTLFNNYPVKLQAAQNAHEAALRSSANWEDNYRMRKTQWDAARKTEKTRTGIDPGEMPPETNPYLSETAATAAKRDELLNMDASAISNVATPRKAGVVPSIGGGSQLTDPPALPSGGAAQSEDPNLTGVGGDPTSLLPGLPPPESIPPASALEVPPPVDPPKAVIVPDIVPEQPTGDVSVASIPPNLTPENPSPQTPIIAPPAIVNAVPGTATNPVTVNQAQTNVKGKVVLDQQLKLIQAKVEAAEAIPDIANKGYIKTFKEQAEIAKAEIANITDAVPGYPAWQEQVDRIMKRLEEYQKPFTTLTAGEKAAQVVNEGQSAAEYLTPTGKKVEILTVPEKTEGGKVVNKYFLVDANHVRTPISKEDMDSGQFILIPGTASVNTGKTSAPAPTNPILDPYSAMKLTPVK